MSAALAPIVDRVLDLGVFLAKAAIVGAVALVVLAAVGGYIIEMQGRK